MDPREVFSYIESANEENRPLLQFCAWCEFVIRMYEMKVLDRDSAIMLSLEFASRLNLTSDQMTPSYSNLKSKLEPYNYEQFRDNIS